MLRAAVVAGLVSLLSGCAGTQPPSTATPSTEDPMVGLTSAEPIFAGEGEKSFPHARTRCIDAVLRTFKNTGHGIETVERTTGAVVSGKRVVYYAEEARPNGSRVHAEVSNKFYVQVHGDEQQCVVAVTKLRVWAQTVEVETRTRRWVTAHLHGFMKGVAEELSTPASSAVPEASGAGL